MNQLSLLMRRPNEKVHFTELGAYQSFRNEGDNIALALTINVNILTKLDTIITLCTC